MPNYITTGLKRIKPLFIDKKRFLIVQGGMRAAKSFSIMMLVTSWCQTYGDKVASVAGISYPHLSKGAIRDFQKIMKDAGQWEPERWNGSQKQYTFSNGTILEFISVDNMDAHGPARDLLFVNEANAMDWNTFDQLAARTADKVIIDYNPTSKFWAHTELLEKKPERCDFIILTYKDNEALAPSIREYIEDHAPKPGEKPSNWWLVYGLGQIGSLEGNVYHGWQRLGNWTKKDTKLLRYGLDFGFNDPTAMVEIREDKEGNIIVRQLIYESGLNSDQYAEELEYADIDPTVLIVADSARPEIIAAIRKAGYRIVPADKNAGSVLRGIDKVQQRHILYEGADLEREYMSYAWRTTRSGERLNEPQDGDDHLLDALRYAIDDLSKPRFDF